MRSALHIVFEMPRSEKPNFVIGKIRDLVTLAVIGATLLVSVAVTGVVLGYSTKILDLVDAGHGLAWVVRLVGFVVGGAGYLIATRITGGGARLTAPEPQGAVSS